MKHRVRVVGRWMGNTGCTAEDVICALCGSGEVCMIHIRKRAAAADDDDEDSSGMGLLGGKSGALMYTRNIRNIV
jgi:hypothetical protein